jgi:hypothetical protein
MPYYIPDLVSKTTCIGNTLSTFNTSFSNLDTRLFQLSTYTVNSVNFLSSTMISVSSVLNSRINFLSSAMISVSSNLLNQISSTSSFIMTELGSLNNDIQFVSSNLIPFYVSQGSVPCPSAGGIVTWNTVDTGNNVIIPLTANVRMGNLNGLSAGQTGNIVVAISATGGVSITSYDTSWVFTNNLSSMTTTLSSRNMISYYFDGTYMLSNLTKFTI